MWPNGFNPQQQYPRPPRHHHFVQQYLDAHGPRPPWGQVPPPSNVPPPYHQPPPGQPLMPNHWTMQPSSGFDNIPPPPKRARQDTGNGLSINTGQPSPMKERPIISPIPTPSAISVAHESANKLLLHFMKKQKAAAVSTVSPPGPSPPPPPLPPDDTAAIAQTKNLSAENEELKAKVAALMKENGTLKDTANKAKEAELNLNRAQKNFDKDREQYDQTVDDLNAQLQEKEKTIAALKEEIEKKGSSNQSAGTSASSTDKDYDQLQKVVVEAREELEKLTQASARYQKKISDLNREKNGLLEEKTKLNGSIATLQAKCQKALDQEKQAKQQVTDLTTQLNASNGSIEMLQATYQKALDQEKKMSQQLADLTARLNATEAERAKLMDEKKTLETDREKEVAKSKADKKALKKEHQTERHKLEQKREEYKSKINAYEADAKKMTKELEETKAKLKGVSAGNDCLSREWKAAQQRQAKIDSVLPRLLEEVRGLKKEKQSVVTEAKNMRSILEEEFKAKVMERMATLASATSRTLEAFDLRTMALDLTEKMHHEEEEKVEQLQCELEKEREKVGELSSALATMKASKEAAEAELAKTTRNLETLQRNREVQRQTGQALKIKEEAGQQQQEDLAKKIQKELKEKKDEIKSLQKLIDEEAVRTSEAEAKLKAAETKQKEMESRFLEQKKSYRHLHAEHLKMTCERNNLQFRSLQLDQKVQCQADTEKALRADVDRLQEEMERIRTALQKLENDHAKTTAELRRFMGLYGAALQVASSMKARVEEFVRTADPGVQQDVRDRMNRLVDLFTSSLSEAHNASIASSSQNA